MTKTTPAALPPVSAVVLKWFTAYTRRYVRKHFHAVRVLREAAPPPDDGRPLVVYLNHASWWDPLTCLLLAEEYFPRRTGYAPIEAVMLERYRILSRIGLFGIEPGTARGARDFLRTAGAILSPNTDSTPSHRRALWLTPQGRFADPRERPVQLQRGLASLTRLVPEAIFLPLAIEYPFWSEPRPEILAAFGNPVIPAETPGVDLALALQETQDRLAAGACQRDEADWLVLNRGRRGMHGIYHLWQRLRGWISGAPAGDHLPSKAQQP